MAADVNKKTIAELIVAKNPSLSKKAALEIVELIFDEIARIVHLNYAIYLHLLPLRG